MTFSTFFVAMLASVALAAPTSPLNTSPLESRQMIPGCFPSSETRLVGNGDPWQHYKYVQLTLRNGCAEADSCETSASQVQGLATSWSATITGAGWIGGGYAVTEYTESGQTGTCTASTGNAVCVWWRFAHTAYRVQRFENTCRASDGGSLVPVGASYVITSPNANNLGSSYICGVGSQCKSPGHQFWSIDLIQGGPQDYSYDDAHERAVFRVPAVSQDNWF
ncbi:hypothetical protein AJ80_02961 [Polytolypa hystricis UAMH7299]|uniref:Ig-like domain-containing protein n=1 Tax=Polytolypa hystricis (strain UAMH7299) TaxID=1447883 RepID=A0A2B7YPY1_POLH7|nr:hypothetical protein AJ80_02961 [Polytolypa hystricis UAMH7299]